VANHSKKHLLIDVDWPDFGLAMRPPVPPASVFSKRVDALRSVMEQRDITHIVVYADREHSANLTYLTNIDPRFEEILLIVARTGHHPLIVTGNECRGYLGISPLFDAGLLRTELFQTFSLLGQPRENSRSLDEILRSEGIDEQAVVGCIGWKYFLETEGPDFLHMLDIPSYLVDALREIAGRERVVNATDTLMHPTYGLRSSCSAADIAFFEYANVLAAEGMKRMIFGLREGMTDFEVVELARFNGEPFGCYPTFCTGKTAQLGLASPSGELIRRSQPLSTNVSYFGSNICRASWIAEDANDLPLEARDYIEKFAGPYFEVMAEWFTRLKPGVAGGEIWSLVQEKLPFDRFGIFLNPGHLIHFDEWLSSPIYRNSKLTLRSGMAIQVDVIPSSPIYFSTRMEDGIVIADATLRQDLQSHFPDTYRRCMARRQFMTEVLGIELPDVVLPLSNIPAIVPPFLLKPNTVIALEQ
jgi:Xaa-Pro aminopeptidase